VSHASGGPAEEPHEAHETDDGNCPVDCGRRRRARLRLAVKPRQREYIGAMAASSPDLKAFLVATPFFGGLSDASLDLLVPMLVERRFDAGATVVAEGEPGRSMFIVHSGALVVSKRGDAGDMIRMARLEPGDFFGEMTLIEMQNRSATVVAECPTVLFELTARNLYTYYKADIHAYVMVMQNINRELCRRLRHADNRIAGLADTSRESTTPISGRHADRPGIVA
jgi:CRP/FNR family transcriptional regulator, cyclic AMP receptor protein